jgi:hypothetical protein
MECMRGVDKDGVAGCEEDAGAEALELARRLPVDGDEGAEGFAVEFHRLDVCDGEGGGGLGGEVFVGGLRQAEEALRVAELDDVDVAEEAGDGFRAVNVAGEGEHCGVGVGESEPFCGGGFDPCEEFVGGENVPLSHDEGSVTFVEERSKKDRIR